MDQNTDRQNAKELFHWIKSLFWEENDARTDAELKFEINPSNGDGSVDECVRECLQALTFDDIKWITDSLASERTDAFKIDTLSFEYDGDFEDGVIKVRADIHLAE